MFELSQFYEYCEKAKVDVIPFSGCPSAGATVRDGSAYAVFLDFSKIRSARLLRGVCCHELGHVATGALHKLDSPFETVGRSEYRANRWAAERFLPADELREALNAGYQEPWELAEYFDLPEADIKNALTYWSERKGVDFRE